MRFLHDLSVMKATDAFTAFSGLDLLSCAVILADAKLNVRHLNPAAENLFAVSSRKVLGQPLHKLLLPQHRFKSKKNRSQYGSVWQYR